MNKVFLLKQRLQDIAKSIELHPQGLGLLGLGSAGIEQERMDQYSDLDFFVIVAKGYKAEFIQNLTWLTQISDVAWYFKNTEDGHKLLFVDGVFCEFAVFEPEELAAIPYARGQFVWRSDALDDELAQPTILEPKPINDEVFLLGELLTNLYVGLCRYHRGEKSSAFRFIQVYALDRLIALLDLRQANDTEINIDSFCIDRRVEQRHAEHESLLLDCMSGARQTIYAATVMLDFVTQNYEVNKIVEKEIRRLF